MKTTLYVFTGCLAAVTVLAAGEPAGSTDPLRLLKDLRAQAVDTRNTATDLQTSDWVANPDWEINATKLDELKGEINAMGRTLARLQETEDSAAPFERKAIEEAVPMLKEMAENTEAAIQYVNEHPTQLMLNSYRDHINKLADESIQPEKTLGPFIQFAKVHSKDNQLEKTLGVASGY
jgi:hypothetical protein